MDYCVALLLARQPNSLPPTLFPFKTCLKPHFLLIFFYPRMLIFFLALLFLLLLLLQSGCILFNSIGFQVKYTLILSLLLIQPTKQFIRKSRKSNWPNKSCPKHLTGHRLSVSKNKVFL